MTGKPRAMKPWLTGGRVPLDDEELKKVCKAWDAATWERYLSWYETARNEDLLGSGEYWNRSEQRAETAFEELAPSSDPADTRLCDRLLGSLPKDEAEAIRRKFYLGETCAEIAVGIGVRSRNTPYARQVRGLERLRKGVQGVREDARHVAGNTSDVHLNNSVWFSENGESFSPGQCVSGTRPLSVRSAIRRLTPLQAEVVRLRFWENLSFAKIGSRLRIGTFAAEQVADAAVFRLKSIAAAEELLERAERASR